MATADAAAVATDAAAPGGQPEAQEPAAQAGAEGQAPAGEPPAGSWDEAVPAPADNNQGGGEAAADVPVAEEQAEQEAPPAQEDELAPVDRALQGPMGVAITRAGVKEVLSLARRGAPLCEQYDLEPQSERRDFGSAVDLALLHKRYDLALQLLRLKGKEAGPELAAKSQRAVAWAARDGKLALLQELLRLGAKASARDFQGRSALLLAASRGQGPCVRALLEADAWAAEPAASREEVQGWARHFKLNKEALGYAAAYLFPAEAAQAEVEAAAAKEAAEAQRAAEAAVTEEQRQAAEAEREHAALQTRLQFAIMKQGVKEVKALVTKGAPLAATYDLDDVGKATGTALDLALLHRRYDLAVQMFSLQEGVGQQLAQASVRAVAWAARDGRLQILQELLRLGAPATQLDEKGQSALFLASLRGHVPCARLLLDTGALDSEPQPDEVRGWLTKWGLVHPEVE